MTHGDVFVPPLQLMPKSLLASRGVCRVRRDPSRVLQAERSEVRVRVTRRGHHATTVVHHLRAALEAPADLVWSHALASDTGAEPVGLWCAAQAAGEMKRLLRDVAPDTALQGSLVASGALPVSLDAGAGEHWPVEVTIEVAYDAATRVIEVGPHPVEVIGVEAGCVVLAVSEPASVFGLYAGLMVDVRGAMDGPCETVDALVEALEVAGASLRLAWALLEGVVAGQADAKTALTRAPDLVGQCQTLARRLGELEGRAPQHGDAAMREELAREAGSRLAQWRGLETALQGVRFGGTEVGWRVARPGGLEVRPWSGPDLRCVLASFERLAAWGGLCPPPPPPPPLDPVAQAEFLAAVGAGLARPPLAAYEGALRVPGWSLLAADQFRLGAHDGAVLVPRQTRIELSERRGQVRVEHEVELPAGDEAVTVVWLTPPVGAGWCMEEVACRDTEGVRRILHRAIDGPVASLEVGGLRGGARIQLEARLQGGLLVPLAARLHESARAVEVAHGVPRFGSGGAGWTVEVVFAADMSCPFQDAWLDRVESGPFTLRVLASASSDTRIEFGEAGEACAQDLFIDARITHMHKVRSLLESPTLRALLVQLEEDVATLRESLVFERVLLDAGGTCPDDALAFVSRRALFCLMAPFAARWRAWLEPRSTAPDEARVVVEAHYMLADARVARARAVEPRAHNSVRGAVEPRGRVEPWMRREHLAPIEMLETIACLDFEPTEPLMMKALEPFLAGGSPADVVRAGLALQTGAERQANVAAKAFPSRWDGEDF